MKKLYFSNHLSPGGNKNTDGLKAFFDRVKATRPHVTECPSYDPFPGDERIRAIRFSSLPYDGKETSVFAYIAFPENADAENPVPGVVLVHGGGGHAYAEWAQYWADNGFAAIAFDGFCQVYNGPPHTYDASLDFWAPDPEAYPPMESFYSGNVPFERQGYTYFVADIILANNLLRSDERVKSDQIGVTGISWGGLASSTVVCYDDRFAFAAPVYGCGFQDVSNTQWGKVFRDDRVTDLWDAKLLLGEVTMPIHFFNSDRDPFFDAAATTASACAARNGEMTLLPAFTHGQIEGSSIPELMRFAKTQIFRRERNIRITGIAAEGDSAVLTFSLPDDVKDPEVFLFYKTEDIEYEEKELKEAWRPQRCETANGTARIKIPDEARLFYFCVEGVPDGDDNGQKLHASSGVYTRGTWEAAEITD